MEKENNIYRIIVEGTHEAILVLSAELKVGFANKAAEELFGVDGKLLLERDLTTLLSSESFNKLKAIIDEAQSQGQPLSATLDASAQAAKRAIPVRVALSEACSSSTGKCYIAILEDYTKQYKKERERAHLVKQVFSSKQHLEGIINNVDGIVWLARIDNEEPKLTFVSKNATSIYGFEPKQIIQDVRCIIDRCTPADVENVRGLIESITTEKLGTLTFRHGYSHPNGKKRVISHNVTTTADDSGVIYLHGLTTDATREVELQKNRDDLLLKLTSSEEQIKSIIGSIEGMVWERKINIDDRKLAEFTFVSQQATSIFGLEVKALMQDSNLIDAYMSEDDKRKMINEAQKVTEENPNYQIEYWLRYNDRERKDVCVRNIVTPHIENNKVTKLRGVLFDVTKYKVMSKKQREMEQQLKQAQKLESIGQLAAGIAHELNTPAQFIGDNLHYLRDSFEDLNSVLTEFEQFRVEAETQKLLSGSIEKIGNCKEEVDLDYLLDDIPRSITESIEGVSRLSKIVKAMKEFSHPGSDSKQYADLNGAICNTITVATSEWKSVAELEYNLDESLPQVECFIGEINQIVLNMVVNAAHAIDEKRTSSGDNSLGVITVSTKNSGEYAQVTISDTGAGISQENLEKIFDPFFTTKEIGKGTGQGLSIAYSIIVERHSGKIDVQSVEGEGTTFILLIPLEAPKD